MSVDLTLSMQTQMLALIAFKSYRHIGPTYSLCKSNIQCIFVVIG